MIINFKVGNKIHKGKDGTIYKDIEILEEYDSVDSSLNISSLIYNHLCPNGLINTWSLERYESSMEKYGVFDIENSWGYPNGCYVFDTSFTGQRKELHIEVEEILISYAREKQLDYLLED